ncbi:mitochondrial inner membrane protease subunit 1-like [Corticium candelabrum]|uniref:mitochondrial inner membrane protease subunit 1-like n=1 Tax=Corticium candelabrum TaxID=121492 RepID=UPI002E271D9B|nr:mitochondrial inner membrane protease subunit 1-like [Corticium candelabrum]
MNWRRVFKRVGVLISAGCTVRVFSSYIASIVVCDGVSMNPAIMDGDIVIVEKISTLLYKHERGSIIVANSLHSNDPHSLICKRIVATPHDLIPFERENRKTRWKDRKYVPKGHVWLEGDNKSESIDSRKYGSLPIGLIQGRVVFRVWPLSRIGCVASNMKAKHRER